MTSKEAKVIDGKHIPPKRGNKKQRAHADLMIKRKLGYSGECHVPFPKCPAKAKSKILAFEEAGDYSHSDYYPPEEGASILKKHRIRKKRSDWHLPCNLCACGHPAGMGTNHRGWGLCMYHEKSREYKKWKYKIAEEHLIALQQRHPEFYLDAEEFMTDAISKADNVPQRTQQDDLIEVGGILRSFWGILSDADKNPDEKAKIATTMDKLHNAIVDKKGFTEHDGLECLESINYVKAKLTCPLTEMSKFGLVEMSDKTKYKLVADTADKFAKTVKTVFDIEKERWITYENFEIWYGVMLRKVEKRFGEATFETAEGQFKITEILADELDHLDDPRKGS